MSESDTKTEANGGGEKKQGVKRMWARQQQKELASYKLQRAEGSNFFNIWYGKYEGDYEHERYKATSRCHPEMDGGLTKASLVNPDNAYLCMHFARGMCIQGRNCTFLHRLPTADDEVKLSLLKDIFGRDRHSTDRDDMSGVGNFNRPCKSIFVGGCHFGKYRKQIGDENWGGSGESEEEWLSKVQEVLARHFGEWGSIERIDIKPKHDSAFITYRHRVSAEFAKVAMSEQGLDFDEQLSVRWAREDPIPTTVAEQQAYAAQMADKLVARGYSAGERDPETGELIASDSKDPKAYPNTDEPGVVAVDPSAAALWVQFEQYNDLMKNATADAALAAGISLPPGLEVEIPKGADPGALEFTGQLSNKKQRRQLESIAKLNDILNNIPDEPQSSFGSGAAVADNSGFYTYYNTEAMEAEEAAATAAAAAAVASFRPARTRPAAAAVMPNTLAGIAPPTRAAKVAPPPQPAPPAKPAPPPPSKPAPPRTAPSR